jgi:hypothetical protein
MQVRLDKYFAETAFGWEVADYYRPLDVWRAALRIRKEVTVRYRDIGCRSWIYITAAFLWISLFLSQPAEAIIFCGTTLPPEIVAQAAALKNDPDLIYEFVYNNIQTIPMHGSLKGPLGALLDRAGTEVDQAELMAWLLAAGNNPVQFQIGEVVLNAALLTGWLGTDATADSAKRALQNGGFNASANLSGGILQNVEVADWVWVKVQINGTYYVFDPAGKQVAGYNRISGVSGLGMVLGYSQSSFLSNAMSGATATDRRIAGLNRSGIRTNLQSYAQNLINYIRSNNPSAFRNCRWYRGSVPCGRNSSARSGIDGLYISGWCGNQL